MITDSQLQLANKQAISVASNTNVALANAIDLGEGQGRMIGEGHPIQAVFTIGSSLTAGGFAGTGFSAVTFNIVLAEALSGTTIDVSGTWTSLCSLELDDTAAVAGKQYILTISPQMFNTIDGALYSGNIDGTTKLRYLGCLVKGFTSSGNMTGTLTCDIVLDIQDGRKSYKSGFKVV
jgi:hypothetical protein